MIARVVDREWEIENIAVAGPARRRGLGTRLLGELLDLAEAGAPTQYFSKSANPTAPPGRSMRSGHSSRAGAAADITKIRKKTRSCIALAYLACVDLAPVVVQELFTMKNHSSVENGIEAVGAVW